MEKEINKDVTQIISANLTKLRKSKKLTQLELANKFNFSDKTISKWESGESLPGIEVLYKLAEFYGLTLNDLADPNLEAEQQESKQNDATTNKVTISLLAISIVWLIVTIVYVYVKIIAGDSVWMLFVWGLPVSLIVAMIFNAVWGNRRVGLYLSSALLWTIITAVFLQVLSYKMWPIFIIGIPSQVAIILWSGIKTKQKTK